MSLIQHSMEPRKLTIQLSSLPALPTPDEESPPLIVEIQIPHVDRSTWPAEYIFYLTDATLVSNLWQELHINIANPDLLRQMLGYLTNGLDLHNLERVSIAAPKEVSKIYGNQRLPFLFGRLSNHWPGNRIKLREARFDQCGYLLNNTYSYPSLESIHLTGGNWGIADLQELAGTAPSLKHLTTAGIGDLSRTPPARLEFACLESLCIDHASSNAKLILLITAPSLQNLHIRDIDTAPAATAGYYLDLFQSQHSQVPRRLRTLKLEVKTGNKGFDALESQRLDDFTRFLLVFPALRDLTLAAAKVDKCILYLKNIIRLTDIRFVTLERIKTSSRKAHQDEEKYLTASMSFGLKGLQVKLPRDVFFQYHRTAEMREFNLGLL